MDAAGPAEDQRHQPGLQDPGVARPRGGEGGDGAPEPAGPVGQAERRPGRAGEVHRVQRDGAVFHGPGGRRAERVHRGEDEGGW